MSRPSAGSRERDGGDESSRSPGDVSGHIAAGVRPTEAQRRYLGRGLAEAGGKLPLFAGSWHEVLRKTIESCLAQGWARPWTANPTKPDWLVCRLTEAGKRVLGAALPRRPGVPPPDGTAEP
jgi:hypothetical protein